MRYKVEDHNDLIKDTTTGSVINTNRNAFAQYKQRKNVRIRDKKRINELENRLERIENLLESLINGRS